MLSKLYLHVGHGKTGSSYLQSCIAKSKHLLDIKKICYPIDEHERLRASAGYISSGNGHMLLQNNMLDIIRKSIRSDHEALLFSSEMLMKQLLNNADDILKNIFNLKEQMNIKEVNILLFIRNPFDMINSIYQQMVKRHYWHLDIDDYLDHYAKHFKDIFDFLKLIAEWDHVSLKVLNYSSIKHNMINEVENWLQLESIRLLLPGISIVNRSLTKGEIELQKSLNKVLGDCGDLLSDHLCEKLPDIPSDKLILSSHSKEIFLTKIEPIITEINAMVDLKHRLSLQDSAIDVPDEKGYFIFSKDQIKVIGESFSHAIANQREEINMLRERQDLFMRSLPFRISRKLDDFPGIKKVMKVVFNLMLVLREKMLTH